MRIGYYVGRMSSSYVGGSNTYLHGVLKGLLRLPGDHIVNLYLRPETRPAFDECAAIGGDRLHFKPLPGAPVRTVERALFLPILDALHRPVMEMLDAPVARAMSAECDIIYFPEVYLGVYGLRVPSVVSSHDLQQFHFPEFFSWPQRRARKVLFGATMHHGTVIQASSSFIKQDILRFYSDVRTPDDIVVIREGVDFDTFANAVAEPTLRERYRLPEEFLFYPAQLWPHKNHLRVLQASKRLRDERDLRIPLVLTGAKFGAADEMFAYIAEAGLGDQVFYLGKVPFADLLSLYRTATFVVTATLYESSSLTLLEACAAGTPVIASATDPNREAAAFFRLRLFDPWSVNDIARVLEKAWRERADNAETARANQEAARAFDWTRVAEQYLALFQRLAGDGAS